MGATILLFGGGIGLYAWISAPPHLEMRAQAIEKRHRTEQMIEESGAQPLSAADVPEERRAQLPPRPEWDTGTRWLSLDAYSRARAVDLAAVYAEDPATLKRLEAGELVVSWESEPGYRSPRIFGAGVIDVPIEWVWEAIHTAGDSRNLPSALPITVLRDEGRVRWEERRFSYLIGTGRMRIRNEDDWGCWKLSWRQVEGDLVATDGAWQCSPLGTRTLLRYHQFTELPLPVPMSSFQRENEDAIQHLWALTAAEAKRRHRDMPHPPGAAEYLAALEALFAESGAETEGITSRPLVLDVPQAQPGEPAPPRPETLALDGPRTVSARWAGLAEAQRARLEAGETVFHPRKVGRSRYRGLEASRVIDTPCEYAWHAVRELGERATVSTSELRAFDAAPSPNGGHERDSSVLLGLLSPRRDFRLRFTVDEDRRTLSWRKVRGDGDCEGLWLVSPLGERALVEFSQHFDPGSALIAPQTVHEAQRAVIARRLDEIAHLARESLEHYPPARSETSDSAR